MTNQRASLVDQRQDLYLPSWRDWDEGGTEVREVLWRQLETSGPSPLTNVL